MHERRSTLSEDQRRLSRDRRLEAHDDRPTNPSRAPHFDAVLSRRQALKGLLATGVAAAALPAFAPTVRAASASGFTFEEIKAGVDATHHVAAGYDADVLIRWGDPVEADAPAFDPQNQTAAAQAKQFGYNNDYIGLAPLDDDRALLCVNHEYTNEELMFPGVGDQEDAGFAEMTAELVAIEQAAHGGSVLEIRRGAAGKWFVVQGSPYNRRITANTPMRLAGPAAGHARLKTNADPTGRAVLGTINNCAGGMTPWGTYLMAEENFHGYFWGREALDAHPEAASLKRYGAPGEWYAWGKFDERFDIAREPNEPNRFGWVVEVDPKDPTSTPVKRTALGRFKHEGAETIVNADGRVVLYMGDDQRFDYVYRFVTEKPYDPSNPAANRDLLDSGELSVARFDADGSVEWMPLVHGQGPLTAENGFESQADVLIDARLAADLLGATPMDRPEDVQPNPATGKVYVMLTNNSKRTADQLNAANPRPENGHGHIIEISAPYGDHAAATMTWDMLVMCGEPTGDVGAKWGPETTENGWFTDPDNAAVDPSGRLWISTDGNRPGSHSDRCDGLWALDTEGPARGSGRHFFRCPVGAELCGPLFTDDGETLFVAVQHPADAGVSKWAEFGRASSFDDPATRWPDFQDGMPPRPSVVMITKQGGGRIG
ncbi:MAG: PhoX family phosphatase [Marivibrio sp.]|uniref:PhoX family protein n=1 Tax=Marivibrio sp. TaxID=2039719 RepID=UPI0032ED76D8